MIKHIKFLSTLALTSLILLAPASHAESNETLMKKGQWKDPKTGLIWMRCSIGQKWTGSTCTGTPIELNWQDANDYFELFNNQVAFGGKRNWRLPTIAELVTLRQCSNGWAREHTKTIGNLTQSSGAIKTEKIPNGYGGTKTVNTMCADGSRKPTINSRIFPNTPDGDAYWSASPYANYGNGAWGVYFNYGGAYSYGKDYSKYVRAVRASQ